MPNRNQSGRERPVAVSERLPDRRRRIEGERVAAREERMRLHHAQAAFGPERPAIGEAWLAVLADGSARTTVHHVTREQVPVMLRALDFLRADLESFERSTRPSPSPRVIPFPVRHSPKPPAPVPRAA